MKAFWKEYGADIGTLAFAFLLVGSFMVSAVAIRRDPLVTVKAPGKEPIIAGAVPLREKRSRARKPRSIFQQAQEEMKKPQPESVEPDIRGE